MNRIDANRDLYESWPIEIRQAVLDGKVEAGMTPDMVRVAWGKPSEVVQQGKPGDEIWVYKIGGDDGTMMYPGPSYPAGGYPGTYPPGTYPGTYPGGVVGGGPGIGISTGRGGTVIGGTGGIGIGGGTMGGPIMTRPPTPPDIREVVFRNGVVHRADAPLPK